MDTNKAKSVKAPAHPVGRPRQGLNARLIFTQEPAKVDAVMAWLDSHPEQTISSFLREAFDDACRKHGIAI